MPAGLSREGAGTAGRPLVQRGIAVSGGPAVRAIKGTNPGLVGAAIRRGLGGGGISEMIWRRLNFSRPSGSNTSPAVTNPTTRIVCPHRCRSRCSRRPRSRRKGRALLGGSGDTGTPGGAPSEERTRSAGAAPGGPRAPGRILSTARRTWPSTKDRTRVACRKTRRYVPHGTRRAGLARNRRPPCRTPENARRFW